MMVRTAPLRLTCLLILWNLVHCRGATGGPSLTIKSFSTGMMLSCLGSQNVTKPDGSSHYGSVLTLPYDDDLSGEYGCGEHGDKIYVKFHSCDLCIDLNPKALISISIADVVATALIGWAVYLITSRGHAPKSSDKKRPVPNNNNNSRNRSDADDTYQALRPHQPDVYDVLQSGNRR